MKENYCIQDSLCEEQSKYKRVVRLEEASNEVPQPLTVEGSAGENFNYARADHEHPAIAPTPPTEDCSTKVATTEFVSNVLDELDYASVPNDNQVIYKVSQTDGLVSSDQKNISAVKLAGYTVGADNSGKVATSDTLGTALGKLQGQINGMDLAAVSGTGNIITSVSQTDGKVSATKTAIKDIKLTEYQKGNNSGAISPNDTLNEALSKLENADEGILDEIENNELVTSAALNDLNSRIITINNTIDALDDKDSAESGKFVTDVVQVNGKVIESNKSFITKTISADSSVETPNADLVDVVKNSTISFTTNPNQTVAFASVKVPTQKYVDDQITEAKSSVYRYKGSKENYSNLPSTGNTVGDVWNVINEATVNGTTYPAGTNWAWNGSSWDPLGGQVQVVNNNPTLGTTSQVIGTINGHELKANIPAYPTASSLGTVTTVNATGKAPLTLEASKNGTTVSITGSIVAATQQSAGTLSAADKKKLDEIEAGAQVNQDAFSNVKVGNTTIKARTETDTLELVAGSNITLTPDATNDKVTISATDTKNTAGTTNEANTKLFIVGAKSQGANPQTYSNSNCYIGNDNYLYSNGNKVEMLWKATSGDNTTMEPATTTRKNVTGVGTLTATTIYQTSDRNMKQNINSISSNDLNKVSNVELKKFEIKNNPGIIKYGVIAQEVQNAGLQNLVESNDRILRVDYISLLCLKIAALEEEIKQLKKCIK